MKGVAPYIRLGNSWSKGGLTSLPFLDYGGVAADTAESETVLLEALRAEARRFRLPLEIRCRQPLLTMPPPANEKVAMFLPLNGHDEKSYWAALDAKVRNQVRKAEKSGVTLKAGKEELLDDFYRVFCVNMRDLGSPVHGRQLFAAVLAHFPKAEIVNAYLDGKCIGGLVALYWKDEAIIPWASTLLAYRTYCPNNALYWDVLRRALNARLARVDFGRSTRVAGTYRFKKQWLAEEAPLCWYPFDASGKPRSEVAHLSTGGLSWAAAVWSRLPLALANGLGPRLRRRLAA